MKSWKQRTKQTKNLGGIENKNEIKNGKKQKKRKRKKKTQNQMKEQQHNKSARVDAKHHD